MSQDNDFFGQDKASEINIREVIYKYLRNWKWFLASVILSLAAAYIYIQYQVPQYNIVINILIRDNQNSADKDLFQQLNLNSSSKTIDNEIQTLSSNTLMEKVVDDLSLQTSYYFQNHISKKVLYKPGFKIKLLNGGINTFSNSWSFKYINSSQGEFNGRLVPLNQAVQTAAGVIMITPDSSSNPVRSLIFVNFNMTVTVAQRYLQNLKIVPASKEGSVLSITLQDADVQRGKDVLNKLVEEYNKATVDDKNQAIANQLNFLKDRINSLAVELNSVEKNVQDYKSANGVVDLGSVASTYFSVIQSNNNEINKINIQLAALDNLKTYLESSNNSSTVPALTGIADPTLSSLVNQLGTAQLRKESLLRTIPETNPVIGSINDQIRAIKQTIFHTLQNVRSQLILSQQELKSQSAKYETNIKGVPSKERGLLDIMRDQSIKNNLFTFLLQKREETALSLASTVADSRTIDEAKSSSVAVKPVKYIVYLTCLLIGFFLPFSVIASKEFLNVRVRKRSDIERLTGVSILADISKSNDTDPLIVTARPRSMVAEQIRALRSALKYVSPQNNSVLLFTSSISGEGKSFISLNLGASLASTNKKVIILELDLRKPKLNVALGIDNDIGISNYLIGQSNYKEIIKPVEQQPNYFIITSGPKPPNPAELLLNGRIETLISELKKEYDYILLDAPPVGLVADAQIVANIADATLYIVRYNYTAKNQIKFLEEYKKMGVFRNLNIVFNSVDAAALAYGYGYSYGYGYGYGYYDDEHSKKSFFSRMFKKAKS